jgi:hypothetical protein
MIGKERRHASAGVDMILLPARNNIPRRTVGIVELNVASHT